MLDTVGLPVEVLVALLADPLKVKTPKANERPAAPTSRSSTDSVGTQKDAAPFAPLVALADAHDWRTLRLLALCPAVRLIGPADLAELRVDTAPGYDADATPQCACAGLAHLIATALAP